MVYLKSVHPQEWVNFCERLGVRSEEEAWKAAKDAQGSLISGEMEVRLWASLRGQTLARTIHGVMEYGRALGVLAQLQLQIEYDAMERQLPSTQRLLPLDLEEQVLLATQW